MVRPDIISLLDTARTVIRASTSCEDLAAMAREIRVRINTITTYIKDVKKEMWRLHRKCDTILSESVTDTYSTARCEEAYRCYMKITARMDWFTAAVDTCELYTSLCYSAFGGPSCIDHEKVKTTIGKLEDAEGRLETYKDTINLLDAGEHGTVQRFRQRMDDEIMFITDLVPSSLDAHAESENLSKGIPDISTHDSVDMGDVIQSIF